VIFNVYGKNNGYFLLCKAILEIPKINFELLAECTMCDRLAILKQSFNPFSTDQPTAQRLMSPNDDLASYFCS
jgi:hypothetical protein